MARILIVDDERAVRVTMRRILERDGHEVCEAGDGEAALERFRALVPDLVLMDLYMPGLDGFEATQRLRSAETGPDRVPIIATTANAMPGVRERCFEVGMDEFLVKPIRPRDLVSAVERVVGGVGV